MMAGTEASAEATGQAAEWQLPRAPLLPRAVHFFSSPPSFLPVVSTLRNPATWPSCSFLPWLRPTLAPLRSLADSMDDGPQMPPVPAAGQPVDALAVDAAQEACTQRARHYGARESLGLGVRSRAATAASDCCHPPRLRLGAAACRCLQGGQRWRRSMIGEKMSYKCFTLRRQVGYPRACWLCPT